MTNEQIKKLVLENILSNPSINNSNDLSALVSLISHTDLKEVLLWLQDDDYITIGKEWVHGISYTLNKS